MDYLEPNEFVPYAPTTLGETTHIHHCKEGRGNDRLYITRKDDGAIVAYCHHCGRRGVSRSRAPRNIHSLRASAKERERTAVRKLTLPRDIEKDVTMWPAHARAWPMKYGIKKDELQHNHIAYSERLGRIVLPCFDEKGTLTCYQTRKLSGGEGRDANPHKYSTYTQQGSEARDNLFWARGGRTGDASRPLVVTEDVLSAIKCGRFGPSVAVLGTNVSDHELLTITNKHDNIIVFLDNDNSKVKAKQNSLKQRLDLLANGWVRVVRADKDPKEHSNSELESLLNV